MDDSVLRACARLFGRAGRIVALTGAGVSAESGVPTFRGPGGLWRQYRAEDLATPEAFRADPALVWGWYRWRREKVREARPNPAHEVLARFEERWPGFELITQNVDGLHQLAGSRRVVEVHGNIWRARCVGRCGYVADESPAGLSARNAGDTIAIDADVPRCPCGNLLRPDVTWFGETLDPRAIGRAFALAESCEALLVAGTSSLVYPAAAVPDIARGAGASIVEVNLEATPLTPRTDISLRGLAGEILPALERYL